MDAFKNVISPSGSRISDPKTLVLQTLQQDAAVNNARKLIENINENCFDRCFPKPGTAMAKGEEGCMTQCMEKYMAAWNTIGKEYTARIQKEQSAAAVTMGA